MTTGFQTFNVLFLCARNSARSIMAEALLNRLGAGRFEAWSAGFAPAGEVSPHALALLGKIGYNTSRLASKPMTTVMGENDPGFDFIIRLSPDRRLSSGGPARRAQFACDPLMIDWHLPDPCETLNAFGNSPAAIAGAYTDLFNVLAQRLDVLANLPVEHLTGADIQARLDRLGGEPAKLAA